MPSNESLKKELDLEMITASSVDDSNLSGSNSVDLRLPALESALDGEWYVQLTNIKYVVQALSMFA